MTDEIGGGLAATRRQEGRDHQRDHRALDRARREPRSRVFLRHNGFGLPGAGLRGKYGAFGLGEEILVVVEVGGKRLEVVLPAGAYHELGVFAFTVALRRLGVDVVYLGADLPTDAWTAAVTAHTARCVVIGVPRRPDARTASTLATTLADRHGVTVCVGGSHQDDVEAATRLGHAVGPAAAQVAGLL